MAIVVLNRPTKPVRARLAPGEELFGAAPCEITCRACGARESVGVDHPALLCAACLSDVGATSRRLAENYAGAMAAFFDAGEALEAAARGDAWYAKTEAARGNMDVSPELFSRAWEAARTGEHAALVELRDALDAHALAMHAAERRYYAAREELAIARAALGEPVEV